MFVEQCKKMADVLSLRKEASDKQSIVLINTCGWTDGLGVELLSNMASVFET